MQALLRNLRCRDRAGIVYGDLEFLGAAGGGRGERNILVAIHHKKSIAHHDGARTRFSFLKCGYFVEVFTIDQLEIKYVTDIHLIYCLID